MSSRRLQDVLEIKKMFTEKESISLSNKSEPVFEESISNKLVPHKSMTIPRQI